MATSATAQLEVEQDKRRAALIEHVSTCNILRCVDIADVSECSDEAEVVGVISDVRDRLWDGVWRNGLTPVSMPVERKAAPGFVMIEVIAIDIWSEPCALTPVR